MTRNQFLCMNCTRMFCRWFLSLSMLALVSCASRPPAYQEQGWASYIADQYTGRPTSSGQLYYPQAYTAAHTSLPFGTVVTVKNIMNGRTVNVTINDRFPYYQGRVINLSSAAAQHISIPYMQMGQVQVVAKSIPQQNYGPANHSSYQQHPPASQYPAYPSHQQQYNQYQSSPARQTTYKQAGTTKRKYPAAPKPSYNPPNNQWQYAPAPSAPGYSGNNGSPPGLKTY
jgi:rare lipoprotein A (peptidoglycan hydrolase)